MRRLLRVLEAVAIYALKRLIDMLFDTNKSNAAPVVRDHCRGQNSVEASTGKKASTNSPSLPGR